MSTSDSTLIQYNKADAENFPPELLNDILERNYYKPTQISSQQKANQKVELHRYGVKGDILPVEVNTSNFTKGEIIMVTAAIKHEENEDNAKINEENNINKLIKILENQTGLKEYQRRLSNLTSMQQLKEIKGDLGDGFQIEDNNNKISYQYSKAPLPVIVNTDIEDMMRKLSNLIGDQETYSDLRSALTTLLNQKDEAKDGK